MERSWGQRALGRTAGNRPGSLDRPAVDGAAADRRIAGGVAGGHTQRQALAGCRTHRHRHAAAALGVQLGDRGRHCRRGRRAGGDAGNGPGLPGHAQQHRRRHHRHCPARRFAGEDQLGDHPRPGAADRRPARHRRRCQRPPVAVAGIVASSRYRLPLRRYRRQRTTAWCGRTSLGGARRGQDRVQGRRFNTGLREMVVGKGALNQFRGLELGKTLTLGSQQWTVVGVFASGDAHDSELWTDAQTLATTYNRSAYQSISVRTNGKAGFSAFKTAMAADPRLKLDVETTRAYYGKQGGGLNKLISILGTVIGAIMAMGAVFGALNTMYAAVATRAREIATMRAIGFRGTPVIMALMLETMLLALLGGLLGGAIAWAVFKGYTVSTLGSNFSQVVFQFKVSPELLWSGLKWALGIGPVGGLFPALRAARLPITTALREL
ncbi:ABC transporter permease [Xanthomonas axonopodis]|uniref:ABC transporter permease n=1 Tax=Xanthomonas axonopodis TaxID=53413 RepID=UPI001F155612|nr:ABC transporter permease [Xanthomonas axonopodis]